MHLVLSPNILHKHCFITVMSREIEDNAYTKFWGKTRCIKVYVLRLIAYMYSGFSGMKQEFVSPNGWDTCYS